MRSVDKDNRRSSFSQYASNMSLTAPGENVLTTFPGSKLVKATGTSFAAPAVTGAVALAMSAGVTDTSTLVTGLRSSVVPNQDATDNAKLGTGTLNVGAFAARFRCDPHADDHRHPARPAPDRPEPPALHAALPPRHGPRRQSGHLERHPHQTAGRPNVS